MTSIDTIFRMIRILREFEEAGRTPLVYSYGRAIERKIEEA